MSRIHLLSPQLANQIAAGEVVERPASVLKELMENSLDAGAHHLHVEVEHGGMALIRVRDDGEGIHPDDMALAVSRHATSKVQSLEELQQVASLGFRGEALASIASISRFQLTSLHANAEQAMSIHIEGRDAIGTTTPAAHPKGTSIEVRDLFYNTPARRRFLRSDKTEYRHLLEVFKRLALSRYSLTLSLHHNGKEQLMLPAASNAAAQERRIAKLCGSAFVKRALRVEFEHQDMRLWGWVGHPDYHRAQADVQYFFLNGRVVRDKVINHALRQAYQDCLPAGRFSAYVLYLELDPQVVDVNVHPTKHEVRFRETRMVHDFIVSRLNLSLRSEATELDLHQGQEQAEAAEASSTANDYLQRSEDYASNTPRVAELRSAYSPRPATRHAPPKRFDAATAEVDEREAQISPRTSSPVGPGMFAIDEHYVLRVAEGMNEGRVEVIDVACCLRHSLQALLSAEISIKSRPLLFPQRIESQSLSPYWSEHGEALRALGIELTPVTEHYWEMRSCVDYLQGVEMTGFIAGLCEALAATRGELLESVTRATMVAWATSESAMAWIGTIEAPRLCRRQLDSSAVRSLFMVGSHE